MPFGVSPAPARRDTGAVQACPTRSVQQNSFGFGDLLKEAKNALYIDLDAPTAIFFQYMM